MCFNVQCSTVSQEKINLYLCSGCKKVSYCSQSCQEADWKTHKPACDACQAIENGKIESLTALFQKHREILLAFKTEEKQTLLHLTALKADAIATELCISQGVELEAKDENGKTALDNAIENGSLSSMLQLVLAGAICSTKGLDTQIAECLSNVENELDFRLMKTFDQIKTKKDEEEVKNRLSRIIDEGILPVNYVLKKKSEESLLSIMVKYGFDSIVEMLLEKKANPNIPDQRGLTSLHKVILTNYGVLLKAKKLPEKLVKLLIKYGADVNARDEDGRTPLICACRYEKPELVKLLLESGANPDLKDEKGRTALQYAIHGNSEKSVEALKTYYRLDIGRQ